MKIAGENYRTIWFEPAEKVVKIIDQTKLPFNFEIISLNNFIDAFKTACGMSLISMISMELAMHLTDYLIVGTAKLVWWVVPIMLIVGFLTPWPYNYWRLKKFGINCH